MRANGALEPSERDLRCQIDGGKVDYDLIVDEALRR
jgi:hypothetical protein